MINKNSFHCLERLNIRGCLYVFSTGKWAYINRGRAYNRQKRCIPFVYRLLTNGTPFTTTSELRTLQPFYLL